MRKQSGFTLIEILVVISIIGMLMALLLPAVQAARETARGLQCRNSMRELSKAILHYESKEGVYPGISVSRTNASGKSVARSLIYEILPLMERNDIHEQFSRDNVTFSMGSTLAPASPYLKILTCPSDPRLIGRPNAFIYNAGTPTNNSPLANGVFRNNDASTSAGFLSSNDGATTTLMLSENMDSANWVTLGHRAVTFHWDDYASSLWFSKKINFKRGQQSGSFTTGDYQWARPSSNHPDSVNVAFCDGSVRRLNDDIGYVVYAQLMTSSGANATKTDGTELANVKVHLPVNILDESDY